MSYMLRLRCKVLVDWLSFVAVIAVLHTVWLPDNPY